MEANLVSYEHHNKVLEEHIREAVVAADPSLTVTYCSPSIQNLSGKMPDDIVGTNLHGLFSLASLNMLRVVAERISVDSSEKILMLELCRSDGVFVPVSTRLFVMPNRNPEIIMVLRHEDTLDDRILYETIEKYRLVFETSKEAMFVANIHGRIMDVNRAWTDAFHYQKNEVTGLKLKTFFPKELQDLLVYNIRNPLISWEGVLANKNGIPGFCRVQAVLWKGKDGDALGHIARIWNANPQE